MVTHTKRYVIRLASERQGSNLRPRVPKTRALTKLRYFPMIKYEEQETCSKNFSNPLSSIARRCGTNKIPPQGFEQFSKKTPLIYRLVYVSHDSNISTMLSVVIRIKTF